MTFDYSGIPPGYYDKILLGRNGPRKFWHWQKFNSVYRAIVKEKPTIRLLDIGCFSGSFAARFLDDQTFISTSIDILPSQIDYAKTFFEAPNRNFRHYESFTKIRTVVGQGTFDVVTFIEVIEHLAPYQIHEFFRSIEGLTERGTQVIISTPNYVSAWPLLEWVLNRFSDVKYHEQHITKFNYWNLVRKLESIYPEFQERYSVELLTTTHLLSPLLSAVHFGFAQRVSSMIHPERWAGPFGALLLMRLRRR